MKFLKLAFTLEFDFLIWKTTALKLVYYGYNCIFP